jgi:hypothetical protein
MAHAAEWGHWYDKVGRPCYEVPYSDPSKGMRPVTLADARKLDLVPSVTTIIQEAAKPGLERWKREQVLLSTLTLPRLPDEPEGDWIKRVFEDSGEQARKAAERGTRIHAGIQGFYEGQAPAPDMALYVRGVTTLLRAEFPAIREWQAEASFANPLGYGGKTDLCKDNGTDQVVIDFKTTDKPLARLNTWDEHAQQLTAYRMGLGMPNAQCSIVYVSTTEPGQARLIWIPEKELQRGWLMFKALLDYWYAKTGLKR